MVFIRVVLMAIFIAGVYNRIAFGQSWEAVHNLPLQETIDFVKVHPTRSHFLFIGAKGNLYATFNQGKDWKQLMGLGSASKIYDLYFGDEHMFLLTSQGLFRSNNRGLKWRKIFHGVSDSERDVFAISESPKDAKHLYLGTRGGLFESHDDGKIWQKVPSELAHQAIQKMNVDRQNHELFIASERGLYRFSHAKNRLDWVYVTRASVGDDEAVLTDEPDSDTAFELNDIRGIVVSEDPFATVAIATAEGVFVSEDEGNFWLPLPTSGLTSTNVVDLAYSIRQGMFIAATDKGIFAYDAAGKRWNHLDRGLPSVRVKRLAIDQGEIEYLYAAMDRGLYRIPIEVGIESPEIPQAISLEKWNLLHTLFQHEPTVRMVQKQAIRYANVSNWKIRRWNWGSRLRAFVPRLSVGKSFSVSDNISLDRGGTDDPDVFIAGPPVKNEDWDVGLNWDLSDLIWNTAQTSIDTREKLMVELRDELLSQATRLYFERRRSQAELVLKSPSDPLERWNALLRIDELTASIDAITDGYLTDQLNKLYAEHPEFYSLWE